MARKKSGANKRWKAQINGLTFTFKRSSRTKDGTFLYVCQRKIHNTHIESSFYDAKVLTRQQVKTDPRFARLLRRAPK